MLYFDTNFFYFILSISVPNFYFLSSFLFFGACQHTTLGELYFLFPFRIPFNILIDCETIIGFQVPKKKHVMPAAIGQIKIGSPSL
jgi:hypothetical protein